MKKFGKLTVAGLLVGGVLASASGCVTQPEPFVPPESGGEKVSIRDAYDWNENKDGSTRPSLDGGYEAVLPPTDALVTIADGSPIRFKGGQTQFKLPVGELLTTEHFDESTLGGRKVGGVATLDEDNAIADVISLNNFTPVEPVTILPFYSLGGDEDALFGKTSLKVGGAAATSAPAIENGFLYNKITAEDLSEGSVINAVTPFETSAADYSYKFRYQIKNYGDAAVTFTVYQMIAGDDWSIAGARVASSEITLQPGAVSDVIELSLEENAATVRTIIRLKNAVTDLSLGVSISAEDTTPVAPAKITLKLPDNFTVKDYVEDVTTRDKLVLPTAEQIENNTEMGDHLGWVNTANGKIVTNNTIILRDMTIAPYWSHINGYTKMDIGSGKSNTPGYNDDGVPGDLMAHLGGSFSVSGQGSKNVVSGGDYYVNGFDIMDGGFVRAGSAIRLDSLRPGDSGSNAAKYEFIYSVENRGSTKISLSIYQINSSYNTTDGYKNGYYYENKHCAAKVELAPGESKNVKSQYDLGNNGNFLTYIVLEEDAENVNIGLGASFKVIDAIDTATYPSGNTTHKQVTIGYDKADNYNIELASSYNLTFDAVKGKIKAPVEGTDYTMPTSGFGDGIYGVEVTGWKLVLDGGREIMLDSTAQLVPSTHAVLKPVCKVIYDTKVSVSISTDSKYTGITLKDTYTGIERRVGETLTMPTADDYEVSVNEKVIGWKLAGAKRPVESVVITMDMKDGIVLEPVLAEHAKISLSSSVQGVRFEDSYVTDVFVGDTLVLPGENDYVNETGRTLIGWRAAGAGELHGGEEIDGNIVLEPIFAKQITVYVADGFEIKSGFEHEQEEAKQLVLPKLKTDPALGAPDGWYNVDTGAVFNDSSKVPGNDITVAPYWEALSDYQYVQFGSGANNGYNYDLTPGDIESMDYKGISSNGKTDVKGTAQYVTVKDGGQKYNVLGSTVAYGSPVTAGSSIRFDTRLAPLTLASQSVVEFNYAIVNLGTQKLRFSLYQIAGSSEYKTPTFYKYEERYRVDIELAPGESVVKTAQYLLPDTGTNANTLTYIVFEEDVSSFNFGIAMGVKNIGGTTIDEKYQNQAPLASNLTINYKPEDNGGVVVKDSYLKQRAGKFAVAPTADDLELNGARVEKWQLVIDGKNYDLPATIENYQQMRLPQGKTVTLKAVMAKQVTVTFEGNNGVSTAGATTSYYTGDKLTLPATSSTTTDGRTHKGWFDKSTGKIVTNDTTVTGAMTLAPYFGAKTGYTAMTPLSGAGNEDGCVGGPDFVNSTLSANVKHLFGQFVKETDAVSGDEAGIILSCNAAFKVGDFFRLKTYYNAGGTPKCENGNYEFSYKLSNYGDKAITINLYQINGGANKDDGNQPDSFKIINLAPGATTEFVLKFNGITANGNALSYFEVTEAMSAGMKLGVAMAWKKV